MSFRKKVRVSLAVGMSMLAVVFAGCGSGSNDGDVAVIDYRLVVENHPEMEKARQDMQNAYMEMNNDYNAVAALPENERNEKIADLQQRMREKETAAVGPVREKIEKSIDDVMAEQKIKTVFDKHVTVRGGNDITASVMEKSGVPADKIQMLLGNEKQIK